MLRMRDALLLSAAIATLLPLLAQNARAEPREKPIRVIYVSPGVVYSGLDRPNGRHGIGGELSVPMVTKYVVFGPLGQAQWTAHGAHYIAGAEIGVNLPYSVLLELAWFRHQGTTHRATRQGFSAALVAGLGVFWLGPRLSVSAEGSVSVALNISLKLPLTVFGCSWVREHIAPVGCRDKRSMFPF
jgi:hypothetical protein